MFINVDLPEPEGPMMATYSPFFDLKRDAAQGVNLFFTHHVGLPKFRRAIMTSRGFGSSRCIWGLISLSNITATMNSPLR
jgi:hypothetical protein